MGCTQKEDCVEVSDVSLQITTWPGFAVHWYRLRLAALVKAASLL